MGDVMRLVYLTKLYKLCHFRFFYTKKKRTKDLVLTLKEADINSTMYSTFDSLRWLLTASYLLI